jgi:hypothetical protein
MRRVILESPFAGADDLERERNRRYLAACLRDSLIRGEAPFASHAIYAAPGVLEDTDPAERALGIKAGFAWREVAEATALYVDYGITPGMRLGLEHAERMGHIIEHRWLFNASER